MEATLLSLLMWLNRVQGIKDVPDRVPSEWVGSNTWQQTKDGIVIEAETTALVEKCKKNPDAFVQFPTVLYGAHELFFDNNKRIQFGNPDMDPSNFVVSAPVLECNSLLHNTKTLRWRVTAYSRYYAHLGFYPEFSMERPATRLFGETLYIGSVIALFALAIFSLSVLYGKESNHLMVALSCAMGFNAIYQLMLVLPAFNISATMRTAHRIGDFSLAVGITCVIICFWIERLIPNWLLKTHGVLFLLAMPFWIFGTTGDTIQMGTTTLFPTVLIGFGITAYRLASDFIRTKDLDSAFTFIFGAIFMGVVINDIQVFTGSSNGYTFMSVGILSAFLIQLLAVNRRISAAYVERDFLRGNLEKEVERKTLELQRTMKDLRHTQAELIHSARLASLGTLSAGIAHEINNSINFVGGAIQPLEKIITKLEGIAPREFEIAKKLIASIRDGTSLTVEIVKSLRQFTGLNQAKLKDVSLSEVVHSVTTILNSKIKDKFHIDKNIPDQMTVYGDVVGINQILMNLITNAMDAMPNGGNISISATADSDATVLILRDFGQGMPAEIQARIFDPFFTTKEVGQGTGLGLYIVNNEMKKHHGTIAIESALGQGTTFRLTFPNRLTSDLKVAA